MEPPLEWPDFSKRSRRSERMEEAGHSPERLVETFRAIERMSRVTGGRRASLRGLEELAGGSSGPLSILDVGSGGGAMARSFAEWGRERGRRIEVVGIDLIESAVGWARDRYAEDRRLRFACEDLFEFEPGERFDIVHCSLVLHHFAGELASRAVERMGQLTRSGLLVNDLHRHPVHWLASKALVPMLTDSAIAAHDGPVSVLRGFRRRELAEIASRSGLSSATIEWHFPFRWLMIARP